VKISEIFNFSYMLYSQIWLNLLVDDHLFGYVIKFEKEKNPSSTTLLSCVVIFLVAKFTILLNNNNNNNNCQTTWPRELIGKIQKNCHISKKKVMKWPRYLDDLG
jgi:hypothetical protein